ncbi:unnamed protein product [Moneuplotes crassus]|uniref:Uncharacterized protein n=1 Tax=Euplotes crassus TaxID=5936 RepID=A0AAD1YB53_EUPCR|nr:unnamed protein product [Moneuplotes crassus]
MWNSQKEELVDDSTLEKIAKRFSCEAGKTLLNCNLEDEEFSVPDEPTTIVQSLHGDYGDGKCRLKASHAKKNKLLTDKGNIKENSKTRFVEDIQIDHLRKMVSDRRKASQASFGETEIRQKRDMKEYKHQKSSTQMDIKFLLKVIKSKNKPLPRGKPVSNKKSKIISFSDAIDDKTPSDDSKQVKPGDAGYLFTFN